MKQATTTASNGTPPPIKIYVSYDSGSARDRRWVAEFDRALKPLVRSQRIHVLPRPTSIPSKAKGGNWYDAYSAAMKDAEILVVNVSSHYLAHDEPFEELRACLKTAERDPKKPLAVVPLAPFTLSGSGLENHPINYPAPNQTVSELEEPARERFWSNLVEGLLRLQGGETQASREKEHTYYLKSIAIEHFKCFKNIALNFDQKSVLPGRWHCLAGINGAGKSAVLEAVSLCLLGPERAQILGPGLIGRKCGHATQPARIKATVVNAGSKETQDLEVILHRDGVDLHQSGPLNGMHAVWRNLAGTLLMGFGATRDFSENKKPEDRLGEVIRRHLSLFDPLEPPVDEVQVLKDINRDDFLVLLQNLLDLLPEALHIKADISPFNQLQFERNSQTIPLLELPSGLRSLAIWFTGLIREWCRVAPKRATSRRLADVEGIVLLDEIDLHLHPKLQRIIVPRLREKLPGVQWIVTTHSPLVITCFDQHELTWLEQGGRAVSLDRQIMAYTPDQILRFLMDTDPESEILAKYHRFQEAIGRGDTPADEDVLTPTQIAEIINQAQFPDLDAAEAQVNLDWWRQQVQESQKGPTK